MTQHATRLIQPGTVALLSFVVLLHGWLLGAVTVRSDWAAVSAYSAETFFARIVQQSPVPTAPAMPPTPASLRPQAQPPTHPQDAQKQVPQAVPKPLPAPTPAAQDAVTARKKIAANIAASGVGTTIPDIDLRMGNGEQGTVALEDAATPTPSGEGHATAQAVLSSADGFPGAVRLRYAVRANKFPYRLDAELLWAQQEDAYMVHWQVGALGKMRSQSSRGKVGNEGLMPTRFSDKYRSEVAAHFDYATARVRFSANTPDATLHTGAQDRLSLFVQLAALVGANVEYFVAGKTWTVQVVGPRSAEFWTLRFGKEELLDLPGGKMHALHLVREPVQTYDQKIELWLAPRLSYLPARLRMTEADGDVLDMLWASSEPVEGWPPEAGVPQ